MKNTLLFCFMMVFFFNINITAQTTITLQTISSADDAWEKDNGDMKIDDNKMELGEDGYAGLRFQNVTIPAGATITSAYLEFLAEHDDDDNTSSVIVRGDANAYPINFLSSDYDISTRSTTTGSVNWTFGDWEKDNPYSSPDISLIVQELVNDNLWSIGNAMVFTMEATGNKERRAHAFDKDPAKGPKLVVTFTGGTTPTDITDHINNDLDLDTTNEIQDLELAGNTLSLTKDNTSVDLSGYLDNTDTQDLSIDASGTVITLQDGGSVTVNVNDADNDPTNEYNTSAQLNGTDLELTDGGGTKTVDLSSLANVPEIDPDFNASPAAGISNGDVTNWNEAHGWGDHAAEGYITAEVDPQVGNNLVNKVPVWNGSQLVTGTITTINTTANQTSTAVGLNSIATGFVSTAIGRDVKAYAQGSVAMGQNNTAQGEFSVSLGQNSITDGRASFAMGQSARAEGEHSVAIGERSRALSYGETVVGLNNNISGYSGDASNWNGNDRVFTVGNGLWPVFSNAMVILKNGNTGIGTSAPDAKLHVEGGSIKMADGSEGAGKVLTSDADGLASWQTPVDNVDDADNDPTNELQNWSNLPGIPAGFSDNIDNVDDADNDASNELQSLSISGNNLSISSGNTIAIPVAPEVDPEVGTNSPDRVPVWNGSSLVTGSIYNLGNTVSVNGSAMGVGNNATGAVAVALGANNTASGNWSTATGRGNVASGAYSFIGGRISEATGNYSFAFGNTASSTGDDAIAMGPHSKAWSFGALAIGLNAKVDAGNGIAIGAGTYASGGNSVVLGHISTASGYQSVAIGRNNLSSGENAVAIGISNTATGDGSTALGSQTTTIGAGSTSTGFGTEATANFSTAMGFNITAANNGELHNSGDVRGASFIATSDKRYKKNINNISDGLEKVMQLQGVTYEYKDEFPRFEAEKGKEQIGFIAQDVQKVLPELVSGEGTEENYLGIRYGNMTAVLVEAVKEQQAQIEDQQQQIIDRDLLIEDLINKIDDLSNKVEIILNGESNNQEETLNELPWIEQNAPNPFFNDSKIDYYIPAHAQNAQIVFYDVQGRVIKVTDIQATGKGTLTVKGGTLQPGTYFYKLVVDNLEVDTKKAIFME